MLTRLCLAALCVVAVGCEPIGQSSLVSPTVVAAPSIPSDRISTICEAIRSGAIKPLLRVPECD